VNTHGKDRHQAHPKHVRVPKPSNHPREKLILFQNIQAATSRHKYLSAAGDKNHHQQQKSKH